MNYRCILQWPVNFVQVSIIIIIIVVLYLFTNALIHDAWAIFKKSGTLMDRHIHGNHILKPLKPHQKHISTLLKTPQTLKNPQNPHIPSNSHFTNYKNSQKYYDLFDWLAVSWVCLVSWRLPIPKRGLSHLPPNFRFIV